MATVRRATRTVVATTVLVAMGVATVACGNDPGDRPSPPTSPEPTASPTATVDPDEAAAREVLNAYLRAAVAAKAESDLSLDGLAELTTPPFLDVLRSSIQYDIDFNRRYEGTIEVVWAEVAERSTNQLVLDVCLDGSNFIPVDIDTGELNGDDPREHPSRHLARHWLRTNDGGEWVVDNANMPNWFFGEREEAFEEC